MSSINTPTEVLRVQVATHNATSPVGAEVMSNQLGRFGATTESVRVTPSKADISDALEELGMGVATRGKNDLDKMKLRRGQGANLEALGRIADYYDKLPSMPDEQKRRDLVAQFKQFENAMRMGNTGRGGGDMPTADDIRKALMDFDGDVTHRFVMLEDIRSKAAASGAPVEYLSLLDELRAEMRNPANAREIKAGFASAREAATLGDKFGTDPTDYRDSYRTLLRENPRLGRVFDELRKFSLTQNFNAVIGSFLKVAGDDMASFGPSVDAAILGDVIRELNALKNLRTVLEAANTAMLKLRRMYPIKTCALCWRRQLPPCTVLGSCVRAEPDPDERPRPDGEELASRLLNFASAPVASSADAERLLAGFETEHPEVPIAAVNQIRDLHAALPDNVVGTAQAREQQNKLLILLSDHWVALDETAYD